MCRRLAGPNAKRAPIPLRATVVWRRVVVPHLRAVTLAGVGLRIQTAPEAYYAFLSEVSGGTTAQVPAAGPADSVASRFRVRVKQAGGTRSRALLIQCASEAEARHQALAKAGSGWVILEIDRL